MKVFSTCIFILLLNHTAYTQNPPLWRYWTQNDGLADTFCSTVSAAPDGRIWINHGEAHQISIFDGYSFEQISMPAILTPVAPAASGNAWSVYWEEQWRTLGGFLRWDGAVWTKYPHQDANQLGNFISGFNFYNTQENRLVYVTPNGLHQFDPQQKSTKTLLASNQTQLNEFSGFAKENSTLWISGQNGVGRLALSESQTPLPTTWQDFIQNLSAELLQFQYPTIGPQGSLMLTAQQTNTDTGHVKVIEYKEGHWKTQHTANTDQAIPRTHDFCRFQRTGMVGNHQ